MLFIRTTLLLGMGVLVLPTDDASQARVYNGAKTAMHWTSTFCERNPEACVHGHHAWEVFVKKAEFGAKMAFDLINEREKSTPTAPAQLPPTPAKVAAAPGTVAKRSANTLQAGDLEPGWRGKNARNGG